MPSSCGFSLAAHEWQKLESRLRSAPMMVLPLAVGRAEGATADEAFVTFVAQAQPPQHVLFTPVAEFQQHGAGAPPQGLATIYRELQAEKEVVLGRVDVTGGTVLSKAGAAALMQRLVELYMVDAGFAHARAFNAGPATFDFDGVLQFFGHSTAAAAGRGGGA